MAKASYTFLDLYTDLSKFQFTEDDSVFMNWIFTNNVDELKKFWGSLYVDYGHDYFVLNSLRMWHDFTFDKVKNKLKIVDVENENIYIHDGQYIINYQDPYGQRGH